MLPAVSGRAPRTIVTRLLGWRPLLWVGLVSYGVYLWHETAIDAVHRLVAQPPGALGALWYLALLIGMSLAMAAISYYGVERPALRLGR